MLKTSLHKQVLSQKHQCNVFLLNFELCLNIDEFEMVEIVKLIYTIPFRADLGLSLDSKPVDNRAKRMTAETA